MSGRGARLTPRSRSLIVRAPRDARSASASCVSPAAKRKRFSTNPNGRRSSIAPTAAIPTLGLVRPLAALGSAAVSCIRQGQYIPGAVSNPWVVPCPIRVVFIAERAQAELVPRAVL